MTVRVCVVMPVAAPYREPLFAGLATHPDLELTVILAAERQPSWDVPAGYLARSHPYRAVVLSSRQLPRPGRTPVMFPSGLETALRDARPDVIVASEYGPLAMRTRLWAGRHGVPHLLFSECIPATDAQLPPAQLRWHRHFARHVDGAIAVSSAGRERLLGFGVPAERIEVALQSADLAPFRAARAARATGAPAGAAGPEAAAGPAGAAGPEGAAEPTGALDALWPGGTSAAADRPLRVICAARLVPDKDVALLARALAQAAVDLAPRQVHLDLVGDGFLRSRLEATVADLALPVTFHGHLDPPALAQRLLDADVFALLSRYEPFGVVLREAAAAGLPLLTTRVVGAAGDVAIADANAILVDPGDLSGAAVALIRLLGDPDLRAQMSAASLRIDAATAGGEVDAVARAVLAAARG